jgi:serine/threonine-protein kinase
LARAAQALRRGDVAAAAAAVPGILGSGSHAATAGPNYGQTNTSAATTVLPMNGAVNTPALGTERKRNPWTWPLIALISLLAVVLIGVIIALVLPSGGGDPQPTDSSPSPTRSSPSPTPTSDRVFLDESQIVGRTQDVVSAYLTGLGLTLDAKEGQVAPSQDQVGLAYSANPKGNVRKNEVITVNFYKAIPAPPVATQPPPVTYPAGPWLAGDDITVSWPVYSGCPTGHALSGFSILVDGAGSSGSGSVSASATSRDITLSTTPGGTTTVTYTALCTDLESPPSAGTTITGN